MLFLIVFGLMLCHPGKNLRQAFAFHSHKDTRIGGVSILHANVPVLSVDGRMTGTDASGRLALAVAVSFLERKQLLSRMGVKRIIVQDFISKPCRLYRKITDMISLMAPCLHTARSFWSQRSASRRDERLRALDNLMQKMAFRRGGGRRQLVHLGQFRTKKWTKMI